ncbi:MAG: 23S rRNA (pseudouridine(1915)-N(3))-methyltransferase RlmH [Bacilli bacterium]|nr:23S rRNA (pseudouridine(1915)-N(3))-methyltransferase RlmH [Bacilli bacterium]
MIKIICIGKIKEEYLKAAITEYLKRLSKYTKIEIIELPDENTKEIEQCKELEGEKILKQLKERDYVITLEIEGNSLSSTEFAYKIEQAESKGNIVFIIGGSYGLSNKIKNRSNQKISFSKMTFPHQLFRVLLLEQIYRSYKIRNNESYHK